MNEKEKLLQFLDYKGISKNKFYKMTGLSIGFLDKGKSLGVDKLKNIINIFPELSLQWLIMDQGEMIVEDSAISHSDDQSKSDGSIDKALDIISSQQSTIASQHEMIKDLQFELSKKDAQREGPVGCAGAAGA